jgi:hypothetical protein
MGCGAIPDLFARRWPGGRQLGAGVKKFIKAYNFQAIEQEIGRFTPETLISCPNIIQYGYEGREPGLLSLAFDVNGENSRLVIRDDGIHFSRDQAQRPDLEADWFERQIGGLGIYFVKQLMDHVTYGQTDDGVNQFVLEKKIDQIKYTEGDGEGDGDGDEKQAS